MEFQHYDLPQNMLLSELALIEAHLKRDYMIFYEPTNKHLSDLINLQREASLMMKFVGLEGYTAVITQTNTGQSAAGNIQLDNSKEVFIDISEEHCKNNNQALAILAHEICHKLLYINGLYFHDIPIKNEVLTDLATVYVGFGKLSLNGCYQTYQTQEFRTVTTHQDKLGYVSPATFAMAYDYVCSRFNISRKEKLEGLSYFALDCLKKVSVLTDHDFPHTFNDVKNVMREAQEKEASSLNSIIVLEEIIKQVKDKYKKRHDALFADFVPRFKDCDDELTTSQFVAQHFISLHKNEKTEFDLIAPALAEAIDLLIGRGGVDVNLEELEKKLKAIPCPHCGYLNDKYLKENKTVFLKCPKCGHRFIWDGNLYLNKSDDPSATDNQTQKESLISKMFKKKGK